MYRTIVVTMMTVLLVGLVSAGHSGTAQDNPETPIDVSPGMVGADSPVYGLEISMDNAAMAVGLKNAGDVAQERAAEAKDMVEKNKSKAAGKAAKQVGETAKKAKNAEDEEGISNAMASLQDAMSKMERRIQDAPNENAKAGMQGALENMQGALQNMQQAKQRAQEAREQAGSDASEAGKPEMAAPSDGEEHPDENDSAERPEDAGKPDNVGSQ